MRGFLERLEPEARWFRFFSAGVNLDRAAREAVAPPGGRALIVLTGEEERVVGHAIYARAGPGDAEAEVAFAVDGAWQGRGLATTLLAHLADAAAAEGIAVFCAVTLPENHRMIGVFRDSGFPVEVRSQPGELQIRFPTSLTPEGRERFGARERDAAVAAVAHVLRPSSVLLVAAAAERGTAGGEALHNLAGAGFTGALHAVLAAGEAPAGVARARTIADVAGEVELAVLALAPDDVLEAARACAARGDVRALVVLLEGSGPVDTAQLVATCRAAGMRLVGPHCLGVVNTDPTISLDATFAPTRPTRGRVAFAAQSGAFGIAALDLAAQRGVGLSSFVSMGAKADLSGNDLLQFWEADRGTDVALLYLESFGNPRRFGQVARRVAARKPVIAVKSGRAPAAIAPDSSLTGRLVAASDTHVDALFRHAGVIRTDTLAEMFDLAGLLTRQPPPRGDRVAVITNAGGLGVQCADACAAAGLRAADPVDVSAAAGAADYERALAAALADPGVDAVDRAVRALARDGGRRRGRGRRRRGLGRAADPVRVHGRRRSAARGRGHRRAALRRSGGGRAGAAARRRSRAPPGAAAGRPRATPRRRVRPRRGDRRERSWRRGRLVAAGAGRCAAALLRHPHGREPHGGRGHGAAAWHRGRSAPRAARRPRRGRRGRPSSSPTSRSGSHRSAPRRRTA